MIQGSLNPTKFDASWRAVCEVKPAGADYLRHGIAAHYLGKWPAIQVCNLGMFCGVFVVGLVVFAEAPKQTSVRYGGLTWELARLWIRDDVPRNAETWLISKAIKWVRGNHPEVICLVSYADPSVGHSGIIYKAANWTADGMTDDERKTPRCDYVDAITGKKYSRRAHVPFGAQIDRVPRTSKHRYIYRL